MLLTELLTAISKTCAEKLVKQLKLVTVMNGFKLFMALVTASSIQKSKLFRKVILWITTMLSTENVDSFQRLWINYNLGMIRD